jgi:hypothetical protein
MAVYRRRKAKKNPTSAKRRAAAKKGAATRKRKAAKRSAAAKKAARTRKRRKNPVRRKRTSVKRRPKRAAAKRRSNPRKRKASTKRRTVKRRRRNPPTGAQRKGLQYHAQLRAQASALGLSSKGTTAQIESRLAKSGRKPRKKAPKKKRAKLSKSMRYARRYRKSKSTKIVKRGKNKGTKRKVSSSAARVSKAYLKTKRLQKAISKGKVKPGAAKMAKAMGLTRVNPAGSIVKDFMQTAKALAIPTVVTVGGMYGMALVGMKASAKLVEVTGDKLPAPLAKNIVPVTTAGLSIGLAMLLRRKVTKTIPLIKMNGAQLAPWVAVGGMGAALLMVMTTTEWGKKLTAKMGLSFSIDTAATGQAAAEGGAAAAAGLGSYMTVSQYLGAYGVEIDPMGASWYGRGDISPMGDFVDAGPQNMFGSYMASDFPVHSPGPGDNINVMATLGDYDEYGQEGGFASGIGGAHPEGGYGELDLEETPGGTVITGSMGEAGIFGGKGVL